MREPAPAETPRNDLQGLCIRCRETKPAALFRKNGAGSLTAWCESCRQEKAKAWGVEEDEIELAHFLYALEESFKTEAVLQARAKCHAAEVRVATGIKMLDMNRPIRIPAQVRAIVADYRRDFFHGLGLEAPTWNPAEALET